MRIVTTGRPIDFSKKLQWLQSNSRGVLLLVLFALGAAVGGVLAVSSGAVRSYARDLLIRHCIEKASFASVFLLLCIGALCCATVIFCAGVCLVGAVGIYLTPFTLGVVSGAGILTVMGETDPTAIIKSILLLPFFGAAICCMIQMCEYAAGMNASLVGEQSDRGAGQPRRYAVRFVLLYCFTVACNAGQALTVVLLRHIR